MDENNMDIGGAVEKLKAMMSSEDGQGQLQNIISAFTGGGDQAGGGTEGMGGAPQGNPSDGGMGMDRDNLEMFMKMQKVMAAMNSNQNSQNAQFLRSLKPFLKPERQKSVESAVKMLSLTKVLGAFKESGQGGGGLL